METKEFFQFKIIVNVLDSSFRFIQISMLWVNGLWKYFHFFGARTVFIRQKMTSTDVRRHYSEYNILMDKTS